MDVDLDAYSDDSDASESNAEQRADLRPEHVAQEKRGSVLNAAERAGIPLEELLPKLDR